MKILVATPVMRGTMYLQAMLSWYRMDWSGQLDFYQMVGGDYGAHPYDNVVRKFNEARAVVLENGYDALMTVESDTIVPTDALLRLAAVDADVAYGLYVWRNGFPYWNAYTELDETHGIPISIIPEQMREAWGQVIETKGVGNGCTLIHRHVLEALEFTWADGEFGCCDWHLAVDCQKLGFVQKHDMAVVCGHIAVNPVHRILWPDPEVKGGYRSELIENWPEFKGDDQQPTGVDANWPLNRSGEVRVRAKKHFHVGDGIYRSPGEVFSVMPDMANTLLRRRLAEKWDGEAEDDGMPGWKLKEPCEGCPDKKAARA